MLTPPVPDNEPRRLKDLRRLTLLDTDPSPEFDRLTRIARRCFDVPIALVSLVDRDRQWFKSAQGVSVRETPRGVSFCGHAVADDALLVIPDTEADPRFRDNPLVAGPPHIRFYAGAPVHSRSGSALGTLCLIDRRPRTLDADERALLRDLAEAVEAEIQRLELDREQRERQRLEATIEGTRAGTWEWHPEDNRLTVNDRWADILGYRPEELPPFDEALWRRLIHPDDRPLVQRAMAAHLAGDTAQFEAIFRMRHRAGHWVWVLDRGRVLHRSDEGVPESLYGIHLDITDLKTAEAARHDAQSKLAERETLLRTIIDNIPINIYAKDRQYRKILANRAELEFLGVERESEVLGKHDRDLYPPELIDQSIQEDEAVVREGRVVEVDEDACVDPQGRPGWFRVTKLPLRDDTGHIRGLVGISVDITREKAARDSTQRQLEALTVLNDISSNADLSLDGRLNQALQLGALYLGLDIGIISRIDAEDYEVRWFVAPADSGLDRHRHYELGQTYCRLTLDNDGELVIPDMKRSIHAGHPCYRTFGLEAYVGVALVVNHQLYGTLNFSSARPRSAFTEGECAFVRLLGRWVATTLEREQTHDYLRQLTANVPGMIFQFQQWPGGRHCVRYTTPGIRDLFALEPEAVRDDARPIIKAIHPEDRARFRSTLDRAAETLEGWSLRFRTRIPGRDVRWLSGRAMPSRQADGSLLWHGYIHDITDHMTASLGLSESEGRLRALFELSPIGIALVDLETGQFMDANRALQHQTGYTRAELVARTTTALVAPADHEQDRRDRERVRDQGRFGPVELSYRRRDGRVYPVQVSGVRVTDHSHGDLVWTIVEDISERKRIERLKNELVSTVSHELRTPLTSIGGALKLLDRGVLGPLPDKAEELVHIASRNSERLTLLDLDKLISGTLPFNFEPCDARDLARRSVRHNQAFADQFGVTMTCTAPDTALPVYLDPDRLEQILTNLLSNAVKFSPAGGTVTVAVEQRQSRVVISVTDQGPGIPKSFLPKLFTRFAQADATDARQKGGTGLGLAISQELTIRMDGRIGVDTEEGRGARFHLSFPRHGTADF